MDLLLKITGQSVLLGFMTHLISRSMTFIVTDPGSTLTFYSGMLFTQGTLAKNIARLRESLM